MNNTLSAVRDFFWVVSAFVRGKFLKQKAYQPKPWGNSTSIMSGMKGMTVRRLSLLMKWWGLRPMTLEELKTYLNPPPRVETMYTDQHGIRRVPNLKWDEKENRWNLDWFDKSDPWGDDNNRFRFLAR